MKYAATVTEITDPKYLGRVRVRFGEAVEPQESSPWCWPCSPFAGNHAGFYCLPQVGDSVWVERTASGQWIVAGYFWTADNPKPESGSATRRVFRTPVGHELVFDEAGAVEIRHKDGSTVVLEAGGDVAVQSSGGIILNGATVHLGGENGEFVVLGGQLMSFLNTLIQFYNTHTHAGQGSLPPPPIAPPTGLLSGKVRTE